MSSLSRNFLPIMLLLLLAACADKAQWMPASSPQLERTHPAARLCPHCGWIEAKRLVLPGTYEYTVRMANGSSSVFQQALPASWRVRERLLVID